MSADPCPPITRIDAELRLARLLASLYAFDVGRLRRIARQCDADPGAVPAPNGMAPVGYAARVIAAIPPSALAQDGAIWALLSEAAPFRAPEIERTRRETASLLGVAPTPAPGCSADPCPTCDEARARADALQARLDAFAGPVEGVDVEAVLEDFDIYQRLDAEGNHPPNRIRMEAILGRLGRQAPALAREVVALRDALGRAQSALGGEIELRRCAEQERDTANARLTAIVEAYQDSTGSQTTAEQLPADIASLAENEGRLAATCDTYEEFMRDLLVAIGADPAAWDSLDEQAKAVEYAATLVQDLKAARARE